MVGRQAGIDIVSVETGLAQVPTRAVAGKLAPVVALRRLLRGTGYRAVAIDGRSFRIVRDPASHTAGKTHAPVATAAGDVIVTASKQRIPLLRYPGSLSSIDLAAPVLAGRQDLGTLTRVSPILQSTGFGPGRDKLFIRGIADSSFVGAAQSTASVYVGDVQLGFSGADPAIRLYDMARVEVLEGPQGTLYGAGAIGGVIRLTPNAVDLTRAGGAVEAGATLTSGGAPGGDVAATLNVPLSAAVAGLRGTVYRARDGGYVDDPQRSRQNLNGVETTGGRLTLRIDPGDGWTVELGGLGQRIEAADAQYAERRVGALARRTTLAQPYSSDILFARGVVTKRWDSGVELVSATGLAITHADDLFDASRRPAGQGTPIIYRTQSERQLASHEMRLSRSLDDAASWVVGIALLDNNDSRNRTAGFADAPMEIIGVTNRTRSASVFAEGSVPLRRSLTATLGLRGTVARVDGDPSFRPREADFVAGQASKRVDPTAALTWTVTPDVAVFGRIQSGYRTGGLAVALGVGRVADFRSDSILLEEVGIRRLRRGSTGLAFSAAVSRASWRNIQADLVSRRGLPYTDNIGNARIGAVEGSVDWVPIAGLNASLSFLYTQNKVRGALANTSQADNRRLPDTPPIAAVAGLAYRWSVGSGDWLSIAADASYVGRSVLGTGDLFDISQGRYAVASASAAWTHGSMTVSLRVDNVADVAANRFASGNPLILSARDQTTPLRPLNARLGAGWSF
nr:TonB-dependent receptor [Sphingomonas jinjuensis]